VDVSIFESSLTPSMHHLSVYSYYGAVPRRESKRGIRVEGPPLMPAKDGYVLPLFYGYRDWDSFVAFLDCPELLEPKFATSAERNKNPEEIERIVAPKLKTRSKHELFHGAQELGLPFGMSQSAADIVNCPQLKERGYFVEVNHPVAGRFISPGAPFKMSESPWQAVKPAPLLGEHNREVLCERLGYTESDLVQFREKGII